MADKSVRDLGALVAIDKPLRLRTYTPDRVPDAAVNTGCLILINDSRDSDPRAKLALSNGASWDTLALVPLASAAPVPQTLPAPLPQTIDITPLVIQEARKAVQETLPALVRQIPVAAPVTISPADPGDLQSMATAVLQMSEIINELQARVHSLEHWRDEVDRTVIPTPKDWKGAAA